MNSGANRRHEPSRPRVAVHPAGGLAPPRTRLTLRGRRGLPPFLRGVFDQFLVAGPICGMLSAIYGYHLSQTGWADPDAATQHIIRQTQVWHGHFVRAYFITPAENAVWWALAAPGLLWLVAMILGMAALGIRSQRGRR